MRFTRIPLIATLLAGALSLLFLLPAFGQTGEIDRTEGRASTGDLMVGVFDDVEDAQTVRLRRAQHARRAADFYIPGATGDSPAVSPATAPGIQNVGMPLTSAINAGMLKTADPALLINGHIDTRNTTSNEVLYVANTDAAYNTVLISFKAADASGCEDADGDPNYPKAIVSNPRANVSIDVPLVETATNDDPPNANQVYLQAFFKVVDSTADPAPEKMNGQACSAFSTAVAPAAQIPARHNDRLTVRIDGQPSNISLTVDAEGPEINLLSPVDASVVRSSNLSFRFDVRDLDAGLRHDGEQVLSSDGDITSIDADSDGVRGAEPLSVSTAALLFPGSSGRSAEIQAVYADRAAAFTAKLDTPERDDDITNQGRWTPIGGRVGSGYTFSSSGANFDDGIYNLQFRAMDRVGNATTSDAELDSDTDEPFLFEVDDDKPDLSSVRTGISYDNSKGEETVDRSSILLIFDDQIKAGDIRLNQITVAGNEVTGVIQPNRGPIVYRGQVDNAQTNPASCTPGETYDHDGDDSTAEIANPNQCPGKDILGANLQDPRDRVYIQLGTPLVADATPTVALLTGAAQDLAGNSLDKAVEKDADDWIAPTLTVSVTGTKGDRPIANADGAFTIDVRSDEELNGRPQVQFVDLIGQDNGSNADPRYTYSTSADPYKACNLTPQEDDNHWTRECKVSTHLTDAFEGVVGIIVVARDDGAGNIGITPGWNEAPHQQRGALPAPAEGAGVDAEKMGDAGLLVEIDRSFNGTNAATAPSDQTPPRVEAVTPQSGGDAKKTESRNPFIQLDFTDEGSEYLVLRNGENPIAGGPIKDSHGTVTINEIELDGDDVSEKLSRVDKAQFSVVLRDLEVGKYTLTYKAEDDAGNEYNDGEFKFEVLARKPYKVSVQPGWNLISLPGDPESTAIGDVLSSAGFLQTVLGYQNGDWLTARRTDDGWEGSLTDIEAGYGYWVLTQTFETVSTLLTEIDPASTPPTVPVTRGWNLLGVIDIAQRSAGSAPGEAGDNADEADNYFGSIPWKVAYAYKTQESVWVRTTPGEESTGCSDDDADTVCDNEIANGDGYWVWSERPSTLVP